MAGSRKVTRFSALPIFLSMMLTACGQWPHVQYPVTVQTSEAQGLVSFDSGELSGAKSVRVSHLDAFEHVEYARFDSDDVTLEAIYDTALGDGLVLDYPYWMKKMVDTWNVNRRQGKEWGAGGSVRARHGTVDYTLYRLAEAQRDCAGFSSEWDYDPRDPFGRPTRVLFGYLCAAPGKTLSQSKVASLLASVGVDERFGESFVTPGMRAHTDQMAFAMAKGSAESTSGNAEFPFNFGTPYFEGENGSDFSD